MRPDDTKTLADEAAELRPMLYKLALIQLKNPAAAEDATQEALLAALEKASTFEGRSSLKTWLLSILRFKILDIMRDHTKSRKYAAAIDRLESDDEFETSSFDVMFDESGRWAEAKDVWTDPHTVAERNAFFAVLEACMTRLPERTSRAFLMREWLELEPDAICRELGVSSGNLRILLYRARMQLRFCLDVHWERT